jgi:hypothetical protein
MYNARVFNVMIASPSDTEEDRQIVSDAIYRWNTNHSQDSRMVLLPIMWETHARPAAGPAQESINRQVTDKSDAVIALFWTKLGTPTAMASSGTSEEVEAHIASNREVLLFFSNRPVRPGNIDREQYAKLEAYRESMKGRAFYGTYDGADDLRNKVYDSISKLAEALKKKDVAGAPVGSQSYGEGPPSGGKEGDVYFQVK